MGKENRNLCLPLFAGTMSEKLLQYIWQFQYFNRTDLKTIDGDPIEIISQGKLNSNQGPDFLEAQIKLGNMLLAGSVELHLQTSEWEQHGHSADENYNNVILHVVLQHDKKIELTVPILELEPRISGLLLERYSGLMQSSSFIACSNSVSNIREISFISWKERLVAERLSRKSKIIFNFLKENQFHWEESFWWMLARNFGTRVNTEAFEALAKSLPTVILAKHKNQLIQLESLLLGQAGLLNHKFKEDYPRLLQREYRFLRKKYNLRPIHIPVHFLRMRPGNFPTIRLAQLAGLVQDSAHLFSKVLEIENISEIKKMFDVVANDYWHYHYVFDEMSSFKKKILGKEMVANLIINSVVPVVFAYGLYHNEEKFKNRAISWLEAMPAEENVITKGFDELNFPSASAYDSQAMLELKSQYCDEKHCLRCAIGNAILKDRSSY